MLAGPWLAEFHFLSRSLRSSVSVFLGSPRESEGAERQSRKIPKGEWVNARSPQQNRQLYVDYFSVAKLFVKGEQLKLAPRLLR